MHSLGNVSHFRMFNVSVRTLGSVEAVGSVGPSGSWSP